MAQQPENEHGGKILAALRMKANLTQMELAKRSGVSRSMIAQLEIGERRPSQKLLHRLCQCMNVTVEEERRCFLAYDPIVGHTPEQIAAFLRADKNLTEQQAASIASMVYEAYKQALQEQEKWREKE
jgi:transcriptional regulator with XRE-family HTH domain